MTFSADFSPCASCPIELWTYPGANQPPTFLASTYGQVLAESEHDPAGERDQKTKHSSCTASRFGKAWARQTSVSRTAVERVTNAHSDDCRHVPKASAEKPGNVLAALKSKRRLIR